MKSVREPMSGPSREYLRIAALPARELEAIFIRGDTPDPDGLAGWEHRGTNTPAFARLLGIKKFVKGFEKSSGGEHRGYNLPVVQNDLGEAWLAKPGARRFGFYRVVRVDPEARDNAYLHALLLDYGRGGGSALDPTTRLRDYLVRVERGSDELLLGKAYVALGPARVPVSMFLLERLAPIADVAIAVSRLQISR
jgi:hypothetical protein